MKYQKKILWSYIYSEYFNPKKFIKQISFYRYLVLLLLAYIIIFTKVSPKLKAIAFILTGIIMIYLDIKTIEKSGEHLYWHKKRTGIPSRSDIRAMKYGKPKNSAQNILNEIKQEDKIKRNERIIDTKPTEKEKDNTALDFNKDIEKEHKRLGIEKKEDIEKNTENKLNEDDRVKGG